MFKVRFLFYLLLKTGKTSQAPNTLLPRRLSAARSRSLTARSMPLGSARLPPAAPRSAGGPQAPRAKLHPGRRGAALRNEREASGRRFPRGPSDSFPEQPRQLAAEGVRPETRGRGGRRRPHRRPDPYLPHLPAPGLRPSFSAPSAAAQGCRYPSGRSCRRAYPSSAPTTRAPARPRSRPHSRGRTTPGGIRSRRPAPRARGPPVRGATADEPAAWAPPAAALRRRAKAAAGGGAGARRSRPASVPLGSSHGNRPRKSARELERSAPKSDSERR